MQKQRLFFLDNLRSATILLVVVFHAALAYMIYVPEWWYVIDPKRVLSADILVIWADIFIMPIMFFISGYFGIKSLAKRSETNWSSMDFRLNAYCATIDLPHATKPFCVYGFLGILYQFILG